MPFAASKRAANMIRSSGRRGDGRRLCRLACTSRPSGSILPAQLKPKSLDAVQRWGESHEAAAARNQHLRLPHRHAVLSPTRIRG